MVLFNVLIAGTLIKYCEMEIQMEHLLPAGTKRRKVLKSSSVFKALWDRTHHSWISSSISHQLQAFLVEFLGCELVVLWDCSLIEVVFKQLSNSGELFQDFLSASFKRLKTMVSFLHASFRYLPMVWNERVFVESLQLSTSAHFNLLDQPHGQESLSDFDFGMAYGQKARPARIETNISNWHKQSYVVLYVI